MNVIERINMLKKMVKEAELIVSWQETIYTALHNIHADWVVSGRFPMARMPDMGLNKIMVGRGASNSPVEENKYTNAKAVVAAEAAGLALASGKNIKIISALTANDTWSGYSIILTAGEVLALGNAVYPKVADSRVWKALATGTATMPGIALATCATEAGTEYEFLLLGVMRHDAWGWTPQGLLYIDRTTAGALTQTIPSTIGDQVQVVGLALTAGIILFNPSYELVEVP